MRKIISLFLISLLALNLSVVSFAAVNSDEYKNSKITQTFSKEDFAGIGVQIEKEKNNFIIKKVIDGGPASQDGIKLNDVLIEVDGVKVQNLSLVDVVDKIIGKKDTTVILLISRNNELKKFLIKRELLMPLNDLMMFTALAGQTEKLNVFIQAGADVNAIKNSVTALMFASFMGHTEAVKALIHAGADVNAKDNDGMTALMYASKYGQTEAAKALIQAGADVNVKNNKDCTALMFASAMVNMETAKAFIQVGGELTAKDNDGINALIFTLSKGNTETAKALIQARADLNAKDINGWTALMYVSDKGDTEAVKALIQAGADLNAKDNNSVTALMHASFKGHTEVAKALIQAGADVNAKDINGWTALMYASRYGQIQALKALIQAGADLNVKDNKNGVTSLMFALYNGHTEEAKALIQAGANLNATDNIPQWSEFCPANYLNSEYKNMGIMPGLLVLGGIPVTLTVIGAPFGLGMISIGSMIANQRNYNNYWVNRRWQFNQEINSCKSTSDINAQINCFMQLRQIEYQKNISDDLARNMRAINNNLNNINNQLQNMPPPVIIDNRHY